MATIQLAGAPLVARRGSAKKASKANRRAMRCNAATAAEVEGKVISYPFVKLVGQDELKLALILNVIVSTPSSEPRGSPRSTASRPPQKPVALKPHPTRKEKRKGSRTERSSDRTYVHPPPPPCPLRRIPASVAASSWATAAPASPSPFAPSPISSPRSTSSRATPSTRPRPIPSSWAPRRWRSSRPAAPSPRLR